MIKNLTPHRVVVLLPDGGEKVFEPSGQLARVRTIESDLGQLEGIPLVSRGWGEIEGLPAPEPGVFFIVSSLVFEAARERDDLLVPDTGPTAVRDSAGQLLAVRRFIAMMPQKFKELMWKKGLQKDWLEVMGEE